MHPCIICFSFDSDLCFFFYRFGFQVKKIPPWRFEISESTVRDLSRDIVVAWNHGVRSFKSLSRGGDWIKFFKVPISTLYTLLLLLTKHEKNPHFSCFLGPKQNRSRDHYIFSNWSYPVPWQHFFSQVLIQKLLFLYLINMITNKLYPLFYLPDQNRSRHNIVYTFCWAAMSFSFTAFFIYEQYELELYHLARVFIECLTVVKGKVLKNLPLPDASSKPMFMWSFQTQLSQRLTAIIRCLCTDRDAMFFVFLLNILLKNP